MGSAEPLEASKAVAEIEIRIAEFLTLKKLPPAAFYRLAEFVGPAAAAAADDPDKAIPAAAITYAPDVARRVDEASRRGVRALLVRIDCRGGTGLGSRMIIEALTRFREAGGRSVAFVAKNAWSGAVAIAVACDLVIVHPKALLLLHGAFATDPEVARAGNEEIVGFLASRTSAPRAMLEDWHRDPYSRKTIRAAEALELGFADGWGYEADAVRVVEALAIGIRTPATPRSQMLAARAQTARAAMGRAQEFEALWPNATSENDPPAGADTSGPEFAGRVNLGLGAAYSGKWVRTLAIAAAGTAVGPTLKGSCSPGQAFHFEAQGYEGGGGAAKLRLGFWDGAGAQIGAYVESNTATSAAWTLLSVDATAPAAAVTFSAEYCDTYVSSSSTAYFDALYLRRIAKPEMIASDTISPTPKSGWTLSTCVARKTGGLVSVSIFATGAGAQADWGVLTMPAGSRPPSVVKAMGLIYSATQAKWLAAQVSMSSGGDMTVEFYDNGTAMTTPMMAIANGDVVDVSFAYSWV